MKEKQNRNYYVAGTIALVTFLVYLPALRNGFVEWDDGTYVLHNLHIRSLDLVFFKWAFFNFYASNWHPLTWISHAFDYAVWGLDPLGHHLTNIILHAINTFLVVMFSVRLLDAFKESAAPNGSLQFLDGQATLIAGGTAGLLFGLHPLHVESVAWIAERKDLLCALFFLLSTMTYLKYACGQGPGVRGQATGLKHCFTNKHYLFAFGFFVLALLSKPMAVTLPVILLIWDWQPLARVTSIRTLRSALIEKLPFMILSLVSSIVTILAQKADGAFSTLEVIPLSIRLLVGTKAIISYLGKISAPLFLTPFYPYPMDASFTSWRYLVMPVLVVAMSWGCIALAKKRPFLTAAWAYFIVTLLPVIGILQVGAQFMADRYMYLPSLGPFLVIGVAVAWISSKGKVGKKERSISRTMMTVILCLAMIGMTLGTMRQIGIWRSGIELWGRVIEQEGERAPMAYYYRGCVFEKRGQLEKALQDYSRAIMIYPSYVEAYSDRGATFEKLGMVQNALGDFDRAIELNPHYYNAYNNKGTLYGKAGSFGEAIASFNKAIEINPNFADAYFNRGVTLVFIGQNSNALQDFNRAISLNPNDSSFYLERGNLYKKTGNRDLAATDFRKACALGYDKGCLASQE